MKRSTPVVLSHQNSPTYLFSLINLWLHIFNLVTGEYNIMDRENSYFSQEQWFEVKAVLMGLLQSRGWHGSGFSNLSHPTKKIPSRPNPTKKLGESSIPILKKWLPFPCCCCCFLGRNSSVTVKIQYRSQRAPLSWIKIQNVFFFIILNWMPA